MDAKTQGEKKVDDQLLELAGLNQHMHPCEQCKCCSCQHVCTRCRANCSPTDAYFIPVVGCPDFADMQETEPVRYLYRSGYVPEYRLRLPGSR
ncbi:MAG: hypothetical protein ABIJ00_12330 [Candidatus Eisenbacteria bacterium]